MATMNIEVPDEIFSEINNIAEQLKMSATECIQLALNHFLQTHTLESAVEGIARIDNGETLVDFPELKEELGLEITFHPMAMEELEALTEDEQVIILEELINRITDEEGEEADDALDLVLKDMGEDQIVLSEFSFGDVVYKIGQTVAIYHIAILGDMDEEDEDDLDEDEDDEDDEDVHEIKKEDLN